MTKPFSRLTLDDLQSGNHRPVFDAIKSGPERRRVNRLVRSLKSLDLQQTDFEYLKELLLPLVHAYSVPSTFTNVHEPLYRAVRLPRKQTMISELGCPPIECVNFGRANLPGNPVFYASAGCHSTIMELKPNQGDRFAISKWRTKTNLALLCVGYAPEAFKGGDGFKRLESLPWVKQWSEDSTTNKIGNQLVHSFISHEFTKRVHEREPWKYKISAALTQSLLNAYSFGIGGAPAIEIAGIAYPSAPNEGNADNVALRHSIAAKHLEFVHVQYVEISQKIDGPQYSMLGLDFADSVSVDGKIEWQNAFPSDLIPGTDHTIKHLANKVEIVDNKGVVVATAPITSSNCGRKTEQA